MKTSKIVKMAIFATLKWLQSLFSDRQKILKFLQCGDPNVEKSMKYNFKIN